MGIGALAARTAKAHMEGKKVPFLQKVNLVPITRANAAKVLPGWFYGKGKPTYFPEYSK
jgi:hypothetical protein